jgi:hypothetical protein
MARLLPSVFLVAQRLSSGHVAPAVACNTVEIQADRRPQFTPHGAALFSPPREPKRLQRSPFETTNEPAGLPRAFREHPV